MLKEIAIVLLFFACVVSGLGKSRSEAGRIRDLKVLRRMVTLLYGAVDYGNIALPLALGRIGVKLEEPYRSFLEAVSKRLEVFPGCSFAEVFGKYADVYLPYTCLRREDRESLKAMGADLGFLDKQMQLQTMQAYRMELEQKIAELQEGLPTKMKLYQSLGVLGGLFAAILLF